MPSQNFQPLTALALSVVAVVGVLVQSACQAPPNERGDPPEPLPAQPHFQCYEVFGLEVDTTSHWLDDQFATVQKFLGPATRLCTPVSKDGEAIPDSSLHLVCYPIADGHNVDTTVLATNQFGTDRLRVGIAKELCVPTEKRLIPRVN